MEEPGTTESEERFGRVSRDWWAAIVPFPVRRVWEEEETRLNQRLGGGKVESRSRKRNECILRENFRNFSVAFC